MDNKEWQKYSLTFKEILSLDFSPVAVNCLKEPFLHEADKKIRICRAILDAGK